MDRALSMMDYFDKDAFSRLEPEQIQFLAALIDLLTANSVSLTGLTRFHALLSRLPVSCRSSADFLSFMQQLHQKGIGPFPGSTEHDNSFNSSENHETQRGETQ